uniref:Cilia- and flagella-associated protein 43 n=1 Tax=Neogobius melanostomus TaxID=47308 RepID=A0A8C6TQX6_9GOBI
FAANSNNGMFAFSPRGLCPSIFVHSHPSLELKMRSSKLDYVSLGLSGGPYLVSCSSLPDFTITVWNWENATSLCQQEHGGKDAISLVFNPWNLLQICAIGETTLTVWNIERNELPDLDGAAAKKFVLSSHSVSEELCYFGPEMPPSAITGLHGDNTEDITYCLMTPAAICWTATSQLYVGCKEGFLLLVEPEHLSVSTIFNAKSNANILLHNIQLEKILFTVTHRDAKLPHFFTIIFNNTVHSLKIKGTQIEITRTWELAAPVTTALCSPNYETLLCRTLYAFMVCLQTVRDPGQLQVWSTDGIILGSLTVQTKARIQTYLEHVAHSYMHKLSKYQSFLYLPLKITSLACCPIANYVALGTASGEVLFIDVRDPPRPRVVHQTHLYHTSVDHLV